MSTDVDRRGAEAHVGLCASCRWVRRTGNRRGSVFYRCGRSEFDARFAKYPPLPVLRCPGYERSDDATPGPPARPTDGTTT